MEAIETRSFYRKDEKGRNVQVSFTKKNGRLFWVRICTYLSNGFKHRADYYIEDGELFEMVLSRETARPSMTNGIRDWLARTRIWKK